MRAAAPVRDKVDRPFDVESIETVRGAGYRCAPTAGPATNSRGRAWTHAHLIEPTENPPLESLHRRISSMTLKRKAVLVGSATLAVAAGGAGVASAVGDDESRRQATGADADRARAAALQLVPGGTICAIERESGGKEPWEIEIRRPDGSTVDMRLGADLRQVASQDSTDAE